MLAEYLEGAEAEKNIGEQPLAGSLALPIKNWSETAKQLRPYKPEGFTYAYSIGQNLGKETGAEPLSWSRPVKAARLCCMRLF